jgi:hypothetical protein
MRQPATKAVSTFLLLIGTAAVAGCTAETTSSLKTLDPHAPPGWAAQSAGETKGLSRAGSITEILDSDGRCMGDQFSAAKDPLPERASAGRSASAPTGIGLDMTECEVVKRAGRPADSIEIAVNDRGERVTNLTYRAALQPGLYRFRSGRLFSIERLPEPTVPNKPARPARGKAVLKNSEQS